MTTPVGSEEKGTESKITIGTVLAGLVVVFGIVAAVYGAMCVFCLERDSVRRFETATATAKELTAQAKQLTEQVSNDLTELAGYTKKGFRDMQLSRYQDELRKLGRVYGTTDCNRIPSQTDADYCRWLKDQINQLRTTN